MNKGNGKCKRLKANIHKKLTQEKVIPRRLNNSSLNFIELVKHGLYGAKDNRINSIYNKDTYYKAEFESLPNRKQRYSILAFSSQPITQFKSPKNNKGTDYEESLSKNSIEYQTHFTSDKNKRKKKERIEDIRKVLKYMLTKHQPIISNQLGINEYKKGERKSPETFITKPNDTIVEDIKKNKEKRRSRLSTSYVKTNVIRREVKKELDRNKSAGNLNEELIKTRCYVPRLNIRNHKVLHRSIKEAIKEHKFITNNKAQPFSKKYKKEIVKAHRECETTIDTLPVISKIKEKTSYNYKKLQNIMLSIGTTNKQIREHTEAIHNIVQNCNNIFNH